MSSIIIHFLVLFPASMSSLYDRVLQERAVGSSGVDRAMHREPKNGTKRRVDAYGGEVRSSQSEFGIAVRSILNVSSVKIKNLYVASCPGRDLIARPKPESPIPY